MSDPGDCTPTFYGPCAPYATIDDITACSCNGVDLSLPEPPEENPLRALADEALMWASRRVFEATDGMWWGCCTITVAPCRHPSGTPCDLPPGQRWYPPNLGGADLPAYPYGTVTDFGPAFVNVWTCSCPRTDVCSCAIVGDRVTLPYGPVRDVLSVTIDGEVLDEAAYTLVGADLVRLDGEAWPACQDRTVPLGSPGTWSVEYRIGYDPPPELVPLVAQFACQLLRPCAGLDCDLPPGYTVIHRDGVDFAVQEAEGYRERGLTGFGPLDEWLLLIRGGRVAPSLDATVYRPTTIPWELR